jgi:hypothetical protein
MTMDDSHEGTFDELEEAEGPPQEDPPVASTGTGGDPVTNTKPPAKHHPDRTGGWGGEGG